MADIFDMIDESTPVNIGGEEELPSRYPRPAVEPGRQTIQRDGEIKFYTFESGDTPVLSGNVKFQINGGDGDGKNVYAFIGTRKFKTRNSNKALDYIRASGDTNFSSKGATLGDYKEALDAVTAPVDALLSWNLYCDVCEETKFSFKQTQFEKRSDGTLNHIANCPDCGGEAGARLDVAMFLVKGKK